MTIAFEDLSELADLESLVHLTDYPDVTTAVGRARAYHKPIPGIDVARLRKAMEHITAHPEEHFQEYWVLEDARKFTGHCGSAMCLAGHIVDQAGYGFKFDDAGYVSCRHPSNPDVTMYVSETSNMLLGLNEQDDIWGHNMYQGTNTLKDLWQLANYYTGGEIEVPAEFAE